MGGQFERSTLVITVALIIALGLVAMALIMELSGDNQKGDSNESSESRESSSGESATDMPTSAPEPEGFAQAEYGQFRFAAVADDAGICSSIGTEILAVKGGSAVDAAIATILCVGVVNAHSCGIGGGHFMTIYATPNGETEKVMNTVLARERAPAAATQDMFVDNGDAATYGGLAIGVPGEVKGLYYEWQRFGRVPWADLFAPTIVLCREGYAVNSALAEAISGRETEIRGDANLREIFLNNDGSLKQMGDLVVNTKLGDTLETIANDPNAFYDPASQLAQDIVADIEEYNGIITLDDLDQYEVYDKDPTSIALDNGNYTVFNPVAPSSGVILNFILKILDGYDFSPDSIATTDDTILTYHRIAEAFKFAYAKRSLLGDQDFVDLDEILANLTSADFADGIRSRITDDQTQDMNYYEPAFQLVEDGGTAHLSILAADGSAVSMTSTINTWFGSKVRGSRTGIIFNNEMDDFSTPGLVNIYGVPPSESNFIEPGKMPMSSMSPSIILDSEGVVRFIAGASGGTRIITSTADVAMKTLWFGMRVDEANNAHRFHHQLVPNEIRVEVGYDQTLIDGLEAKGHVFDISTAPHSYVQSIHNTCGHMSHMTSDDGDETMNEMERDCIHAASDGRKAGIPDGY